MSLFLQYQLAQSLGDLGGGADGAADAAAGGAADAASAGFGFALGALMPPLIWRSMRTRAVPPWGGIGTPTPHAPPTPRFCGHCGAPLVAAARFCGHCGTGAWR
jgi:hypothetical protein